MSPIPAYDRPELRPEGFKGVAGSSVPNPKRGQPQPTPEFPKDGQGGGNNGSKG